MDFFHHLLLSNKYKQNFLEDDKHAIAIKSAGNLIAPWSIFKCFTLQQDIIFNCFPFFIHHSFTTFLLMLTARRSSLQTSFHPSPISAQPEDMFLLRLYSQPYKKTLHYIFYPHLAGSRAEKSSASSFARAKLCRRIFLFNAFFFERTTRSAGNRAKFINRNNAPRRKAPSAASCHSGERCMERERRRQREQILMRARMKNANLKKCWGAPAAFINVWWLRRSMRNRATL